MAHHFSLSCSLLSRPSEKWVEYVRSQPALATTVEVLAVESAPQWDTVTDQWLAAMRRELPHLQDIHMRDIFWQSSAHRTQLGTLRALTLQGVHALDEFSHPFDVCHSVLAVDILSITNIKPTLLGRWVQPIMHARVVDIDFGSDLPLVHRQDLPVVVNVQSMTLRWVTDACLSWVRHTVEANRHSLQTVELCLGPAITSAGQFQDSGVLALHEAVDWATVGFSISGISTFTITWTMRSEAIDVVIGGARDQAVVLLLAQMGPSTRIVVLKFECGKERVQVVASKVLTRLWNKISRALAISAVAADIVLEFSSMEVESDSNETMAFRLHRSFQMVAAAASRSVIFVRCVTG